MSGVFTLKFKAGFFQLFLPYFIDLCSVDAWDVNKKNTTLFLAHAYLRWNVIEFIFN